MPAPLALPPLPPPRLELPSQKRSRLGVWVSLVAHLVVLLVVAELTRDANFWDESARAQTGLGGKSGGGGGRPLNLVTLTAPPPAPAAVRPPVQRVPPPVDVPKAISKPEPTPVAPPAADTTPNPPQTPQPTPGSGGGTGGGAGTGTGPGSGAGKGPGSSATGAGTVDSVKHGSPPEPRQLIVPPFDYPRSMRGVEVDVNFFVRADGRVERVVFIPEIPDRAYAKKLEDVMRAYRFRPARSPEGLPVPGNTVVRISF